MLPDNTKTGGEVPSALAAGTHLVRQAGQLLGRFHFSQLTGLPDANVLEPLVMPGGPS